MIGEINEGKKTEAFYQVARDLTRYIHYGVYDVFSDIIDSSCMSVEEIQKFFSENPDLLPDNPFEARIADMSDLYRCDKINDLTYDIEYDFVHGTSKAYMTLCLQFVYDQVEPYITVEIKDIRKN